MSDTPDDLEVAYALFEEAKQNTYKHGGDVLIEFFHICQDYFQPKEDPVARVTEKDMQVARSIVEELKDLSAEVKALTSPPIPVAIVTGSSVQWLPNACKVPDRSPLYTSPPIPAYMVMVPREILDRFPELNMSNYSPDNVEVLNNWGIELVLAAAPKGGA